MSAIAGIWYREAGRAAGEGGELVDAMLGRMAHRGGDQRAIRYDDSFCVGADVRWTTPEAPLDLQPLVLADPVQWLVLDGRLDNRSEIASALGTQARSGSAPTDAELIGRWLSGASADPARLIGDFALACWDPARRHLLLMRDALGMRPLYYACTDHAIWFASSLAAMVVPPWYTPEPDEGFIAEFLASAPASLHDTPLRGIHRLPQGERLDVADGRVTRRAYWTLEVSDESPISEQDAADEFRHLFSSAVQARLRAREPVAFQLSGGLDSSTVVGMATTLGVERPQTYSLVFPDVAVADETEFIDAVVHTHHCRSVRHAFPRPDPCGFAVCDHALRDWELADGATGGWMLAPLLERASADGHAVMLGGAGGDEWLTGSLFQIPALIRRGQWLSARRYVDDYRRIGWLDPGLVPILRTTAVALMPEWLKRVLRQLRPETTVRPWITEDLSRRVNLPDRMRAPFRRVPPTRHPVVRESLVRLTSGDSAFVREALDRMGAAAGLELRHPFLDRRVVEFLIRLPDDLRFRDGTHRYLLRRACGDVLPPLIRSRTSKPDIDHVVVDTIRASEPASWLESMQVVERGWVDAAVVADLWRRCQRPPEQQSRQDIDAPLQLWQVVAVEAWLRGIFSIPTHVPDSR